MRDQLKRRGVRPMQVVKDQHHWALCRQLANQRADRVMQPVALGLQPGRPVPRTTSQRGKHRLKLGDQLGRDALDQRSGERPERGIKRADRHRERHILLKLRRASTHHPAALALGDRCRLLRQPRLADPRLTADRHTTATTNRQLAQRESEHRQLLLATNQRRATARSCRQHQPHATAQGVRAMRSGSQIRGSQGGDTPHHPSPFKTPRPQPNTATPTAINRTANPTPGGSDVSPHCQV